MIAESESKPVDKSDGKAASAAIEVNDLRKIYRSGWLGGRLFGSEFPALKGVSFRVNRGEIFGLLGPNGAGKTTCLKILLGIIRKTSGAATLLGQTAGSLRGRMEVGYLPEHLRIPSHLTGNTALEVYGNLSNVPSRVVREKRGELLELVGLSTRAKEKVRKYSKGMLQRLGLAQALLHEPKLLVLDEPTDGLDPRARADMRNIIRQLQQRGVTIFLNSHILQEVEMICQRVAILDRGNLRYCGPVNKIGDFVSSLVGKTGTGNVFDFQLKGSTESIQRALEGMVFEFVNQTADARTVSPGTEHKVRVSVPSADEVDDVVDRLRGEKISLIGLEQNVVTLEEAFLEIVDENSGY